MKRFPNSTIFRIYFIIGSLASQFKELVFFFFFFDSYLVAVNTGGMVPEGKTWTWKEIKIW